MLHRAAARCRRAGHHPDHRDDADMNQPNSPVPPDLRALLLALRTEIFVDLNCCQVGTIRSFNATLQTASASINMQRQVAGAGVAYPLLVDVPVVCLGGGASRLTFPIAAGDPCLLFFCDRNFDAWFGTGSTSSPPNTPRTHSLADGFALVGVRSKPGALTGYNTTDIELALGGGFIHVNSLIGI